jgi:hypothetical protein
MGVEVDFNPFVCEHCGSGNCAYLVGADCPKLLKLQDEYYEYCTKLENLFKKWEKHGQHEYGAPSAVFQFESEQERVSFLQELSTVVRGENWYLFAPYNVEVFLN